MNTTQTVAGSIALLSLLLTALSVHISRLRLRHRVSFGDGGHKDLLVAVRAHGNALEHISLYAALALGLLSLPGEAPVVLTACALVFTLARFVHAGAILGRRLALRQAAHVLSTAVHLVLALTIGITLLT